MHYFSGRGMREKIFNRLTYIRQKQSLPKMQTDTHHELALQIAESLHRRMLVLEAKAATPMTPLDAGLFDVDGYLGDAERVLEGLHNIQNYEETIRYYADRLQGIYALFQQEPINWFLIINEILDVL